MDQSACKLTLVYPAAFEAQLVELLMDSDPPLAGFTSWGADGHGHTFEKANMRERVRGRVARGVLVLLLERQRLPELLEAIRTKVAIPDLLYWIEPIEGFGRLSPAS